MTISRSAVEQFLNKERDSFDWLKEVSSEDIDEEIKNLNPQPEFYGSEPFFHQKVCFFIGAFKKQFLWFVSAGLGKTRISLDLIAYHKKCGNLNGPTLVLVPNVGNMLDWYTDAQKFQPELKVEKLEGSTKQRIAQLESTDSDILILNYDGLVSLVSTRMQQKKKDKGKMVVDKIFADELFSMFDGVIFDESTHLKNHQSLTFQACSRLSRHVTIKYGLTGTPFDKDPQDLWAQFYAVDGGETLGETLGIFREAFCTKHKNQFSGSYDFSFDRRKKSKLSKIIKNRSILYTEDEVSDMPEKVYVKRHVPMPKEVRQYYTDIRQAMKDSDKSYKTIENNFLKMRQLSSGFMGVTDEDNGEKLELELKTKPKVDELEEILREIPNDKKVVIFHVFIHSANLIHEVLNKLNINYATLDGQTEDKEGEKERFTTDPSCRVLTTNVATGKMGLNLQVASYTIYFESPVSSIDRQQSEKRTHRSGQQSDRVFYIDIVMEGSVDEKILTSIQEGKDLFEEVVKGDESL